MRLHNESLKYPYKLIAIYLTVYFKYSTLVMWVYVALQTEKNKWRNVFGFPCIFYRFVVLLLSVAPSPVSWAALKESNWDLTNIFLEHKFIVKGNHLQNPEDRKGRRKKTYLFIYIFFSASSYSGKLVCSLL